MTVFVTLGGNNESKYHLSDECKYVAQANTVVESTYEHAEANGRVVCRHCAGIEASRSEPRPWNTINAKLKRGEIDL